MSHSRQWRQPPPEQLDCEQKLKRALASLLLKGRREAKSISYDHIDNAYEARALAPYLEQAQTLGTGYARQQLTQVERSSGSAFKRDNPLQKFLDQARDLIDRALNWAKDLFASKIEQLGDDPSEEDLEQVLEDTAETVAETLALTEIQGTIEQEVMDVLQEAGVTMIQVVNEPDACELCVGNAEAGPIPIGTAFPSGQTSAPFHHRCRCHVEAV